MEDPKSAAETVPLEALAAAIAPARDDAEWQDGLDLLALAAGLKPVAMFGRGAGAIESWDALARRFDLPTIEAAPWDAAPPKNFFPRWYLDATSARRARQKILLVAREDALLQRARALAAKGRVSVAEEAEILGYPPCCVAEHHAAALAHERQTAYLVGHANPDDEALRMRLVASGATPYLAPPVLAPSRWTSVNLCRVCAAGTDGPARGLERAYAALAARLAYPARA